MIGNNGKFKTALMMVLLLLYITIFSISVLAEEEITLEATSTNMEMGISGQLTLTIHTKLKVEEVGIEGIDAFEVMSTSQSTSTQIINGESTYSKSYLISIMPKEVGTFTLTGQVHDGKTLHLSNSITINVGERSSDMADLEEEVFLRTVLSKDESYFGEKVVLTYKLYSRYNLDGYGFLEDVNLDGFFAERIPEDQLQSNYVTIDGNQYVMYEVAKWILTPMEAKTYEISGYNFQANLSTGSFFSDSEPRYILSQPATLEVNGLPNQPAGFSGIVGSLLVDAAFDKDQVAYPEPITLSLSFLGSGGLDQLGALYTTDQGFTVYETDQSVEKVMTANGYTESKGYDVIFVPKTVGELVIQPKEIIYFNTETGTYETIEIPGTTIEVTGDESMIVPSARASTGSTTINQIGLQEQQGDYFYVKLSKKVVLYAGIFLVGIIFLLLLYRQFKKRKLSVGSNQYSIKLKQAKTLEDLKALLEAAVYDQTGLNINSSSIKEIQFKINNQALAKAIGDMITYLEYGRFYEEKSITQVKKEIGLIIEQIK